jgi:hypothetical protein
MAGFAVQRACGPGDAGARLAALVPAVAEVAAVEKLPGPA